ncbi:MAG: hypothetical protein H0W70_15535, partial [Actinobacteria bacterium]|nr:hypothetical protein [Actinomycetota bacterium]
ALAGAALAIVLVLIGLGVSAGRSGDTGGATDPAQVTTTTTAAPTTTTLAGSVNDQPAVTSPPVVRAPARRPGKGGKGGRG